jgi:glycosyltransferase involved in cell wall biosynthesis
MVKIPVTVIIPVKNEEIDLPNCLKQLTDFDQLILIDSGSTDQTSAIAHQFKVEYYNFVWDGKFPKKRNWALRNLEIKNEWVLFLDADEYLTDGFKKELAEKIKSPHINGFWVTYQNHFMGRKLQYGDTMKKLSVFRKGQGEYEKIEEDSWSHLDMEVHEHPIIKGSIGKITQPVIHNDFKGLEHYIARHNAYSSWEAKRYMQLTNSGFSKLFFRQKIKYKLIKTGILPIVYFFGSYFLKLGFLDGKPGYYLALYKANYFFQIQTKIIELHQLKGN